MNELVGMGVGRSDQRADSRYYLAPVAGTGWLVGIWLADALNLNAIFWLILAVPLVTGAVVLWQRGRLGLVMACFAALALGGVRYKVAEPPVNPGQIQFYNGVKDVVLLGEVTTEPVLSDTSSQLRVRIREFTEDGQTRPVAGTVQVKTDRYPEIPYGATLELTGDLAPPTLGSPGYAAYLERQGVHSVMEYPRVDILETGGGSALYRKLLALKERGRAVIAASLPEPHAALLTGILLGDDSGMPRDLSNDFRETGMTHIIAISGFNIAVIIAVLDSLITPLVPRRWAAVLIMALIGLYAIFVGGAASVVRAAIMGAMYLAGMRLLGRPTLIVAGLFCAAFLMTLIRPNALWDVGFQLSFAATLGLVVYAGRWTRRLDQRASTVLDPRARGRVVRVVSEVLIVTLAAQVLALPLLLFHFGNLSLVSLPANALVLPVQPAVMATGGMTLLLGLALPMAGQVAGWLAWLFLHYTINVIRLLAQVPFASVPLSPSEAGLVIVYGLIVALTILPAVRGRRDSLVSSGMRLNRRLVYSGIVIGLFGLLLWGWYSNRPDGRLHVIFLDVGQGDAIFIQSPGGRQVLIDGGRFPSVTLDEFGQHMPFWDRSIDMVIATHPDADHVAGLVEVMARYDVGSLITNAADEDDDAIFAALLNEAQSGGAMIHEAREGDVIKLEDGVELEVLHSGSPGTPDHRNDDSIVTRLTYGDLSVLLTGDAEEAAETEMVRGDFPLGAIVLKAGHHGANTSSSTPFLEAVSPRIVVISVGADNSYGHPHPAMLARAEAVGATVLRTDLMGTIELESDGRRMWWSSERSGDLSIP